MAAAGLSNVEILEQLREGVAEFELFSSPFPPTSTLNPKTQLHHHAFHHRVPDGNLKSSLHFFARIGPSLGGDSQALKRVERYSVQKVAGDGRCMFRALVKGMALNKGKALGPREEREGADELRMAVKEVICDNDKERLKYEEALIAITVDESLNRYCQRIGRADFWGGEPELLVLSKLLCQPIIVYIPEHEYGRGTGFTSIAEYGGEFREGTKNRKARQAVKLLFNGWNHYDLLV
ncbi:unnamed protein product [Cuscuta epithymum]|uniref:Ubiquitin thioesterase OTU n=1 Tax=Cuscuta epithymum TaxID=186058 RepID=A0AAV0D2Y3_9ASTE|nr:unnamed protein product [Cuscuta epithymum]